MVHKVGNIASLKKVLVGGCFDILHYAHLTFLKEARALGEHLIVLLEPDERILQSKKRQPVHTQAQRQEILCNLRDVDQVIPVPLLHSYEDYLSLVRQVQPHIIAVTEGDPQMILKKRQAQVIGAELIIVTPFITGFSSTSILNRLCSG